MSESKESRLARLATLARLVLSDDDKAEHWLTVPQPGLGNRRPIDLVGSDSGYRKVEDLLLRIEYGVYS